jgi:energy-coupling factor transporter ATP-binding protein EcfA2
MLKLRRLRVEKFRSVAKGAELSFSDGINVFLGQNGTGKTTLLELVSMVVRSDFSSLAKEEFAIEYELSVDEGESLIVVVRNERQATEPLPAPFELAAREVFQSSAEVLGGTDRRRLLRYDSEHGLSMENGPPMGLQGMASCLDPAFLWFFVVRIAALKERFSRELLKAGGAHRFDESLDTFRRITAQHLLGDVLVSDPHRWVRGFSPWFLLPEHLVERVMASYEPKKPDYSFTHKDLDFLATLKNMMAFSSSELRVDVTERRHEMPTYTIVGFANLVIRCGWEDGTVITHDSLSYGQKRLVTFFYYLASNPDTVIADELVNGLHHRWITASIEAIGERQAFLTSQNPLLLDYIPITSAEAVRRSFVLCRGEPREGRPGWIWENMSEDDAHELFSAYEVGVEHVSEILQSRGLW